MNICIDCGIEFETEIPAFQCPYCEQEETRAREEVIWKS